MVNDKVTIKNKENISLELRMGSDFLSELNAPAPLKEFIVNNSRNLNGKQTIYNSPRVADRDLTLQFVMTGNSPDDFRARMDKFYKILHAGYVELVVPVTGRMYKLTYLRSQSYAQNRLGTTCKISVRFNEPEPVNYYLK